MVNALAIRENGGKMEKIDCKHANECLVCEGMKDANKVCSACKFYRFLDSGYGLCIVFPTFTIMAWCRDICGQFQKREAK